MSKEIKTEYVVRTYRIKITTDKFLKGRVQKWAEQSLKSSEGKEIDRLVDSIQKK